MFKRKAYEKLLTWKSESNGKTAVLVEGARRVGKTTLVKEFATREYADHLYIDFSSIDSATVQLFNEQRGDIDVFLRMLQLNFGRCSSRAMR